MPRTYLDFDLLIERAGSGYRARVLDSPSGQAAIDFVLPFSSLEIENFLLRITRSLGDVRRRIRRLESPERELVREFGGQLFGAVFSGTVQDALQSSLNEAYQKSAGLRLRLHLTDTPELADLPWEFLHNPSSNRFLSLSPDTPLVRYLDLPLATRPLAVTPPIRVLVMISSPNDFPQLDVAAEWDRLESSLHDLIERGLVSLTRLPSATLASLQRPLRLSQYHIFHFIGHGGFDEQSQDGALALQDAQGRGRLVSGQDLGVMLSDHRSLRLVILNACEGARSSASDPFAGVAQSLIQQAIPAVIAMQFEITDEAAITFAHEFYGAVADGYPVDAALAESRRAIFAQGNEVEWATPVLHMRSPNGQLFRLTRGPLEPLKEAAEREGAHQKTPEEAESEAAEREGAHQKTPEEAEPAAEREPAEREPAERKPVGRGGWFGRLRRRKVLALASVVLLIALAAGAIGAVAALRGGGGQETGPAGLDSPEGIALAADGTVYVADTGNNRVVAIHPATGAVTTVAGDGTAGYSGDGGRAQRAQLNRPQAVAVAPDGTIYVADNDNSVIRRIVRGIIATVRPEPGGDVSLSGASALAVDQEGRLLIATETHLYAIGSDGALVSVAGTGTAGFTGDGGAATNARVDQVADVAIDPRDGSIYIADYDNNVIRRINSDGTIETVAGNGTPNYTEDGQRALDVGLDSPTAVAFGTQGSLYISQNNIVRLVEASGIIRTVIDENDAGFAVVRGRVSGVHFDGIRVRVDVDGNLYILDRGNNRIRKVSADGTTIDTIG